MSLVIFAQPARCSDTPCAVIHTSVLVLLLSGCMEAGYSDFGQVRSDPDLEFLRADSRFEVRCGLTAFALMPLRSDT